MRRSFLIAICCVLIPALLGVFFFSSYCLADSAYQWEDAEGRLHFGNKPPVNAKKVEKVEAELSHYSSKRFFEGHGRDPDADLPAGVQPPLDENLSSVPILLVGQVVCGLVGGTRVSGCTVRVENSGASTATNVKGKFVFGDGTNVDAEGLSDLPAGETSTYTISQEKLPLEVAPEAIQEDGTVRVEFNLGYQ